jgi:hypothetical protein
MQLKFFKNLFSNFYKNQQTGFSIKLSPYENEPRQIKLSLKKIEDLSQKYNVSSEIIIDVLIEYEHVTLDESGQHWTHHKIEQILKSFVISKI